jgi:MFS family permease
MHSNIRRARGRLHSPLWRHADFLRLWTGQSISELGSQVTLVALPLTAILVLHASAFRVAILSSFEFAPFLLFGVIAGVWIDRLPYRQVLIVADLARAAALGSVPLAYAFGALTLGQLYAVGFLTGTFTVFFSLAYHAYLPSMLERDLLMDANAKLESTRSIAQTAGPAAGGGLVTLASAPAAIIAEAASFVFSAALLIAIRAPARRPSEAPSRDLRSELREGLGYLWHHPIFRANLFSAGLANFSYGIVWAILLVFAVRQLHLNAATIGAVLAVGQAGGIAGAILARRIARILGIGPALIAASALIGPATLILASATPSTAVPFLIIGWALWSFTSLMSSVIGVSIRQALVPQRLQGRVVGATRSIIFGVAPIGSLVGGTIAATAGLRAALFAGAGAALFAFLPLALSPVRTLRELPSEPEELRLPAVAPEPAR